MFNLNHPERLEQVSCLHLPSNVEPLSIHLKSSIVNGLDHLDLNFPGDNFNLELKRSFCPCTNSDLKICFSWHLFVCSLQIFAFSYTSLQNSSISFSWRSLCSPKAFRSKFSFSTAQNSYGARINGDFELPLKHSFLVVSISWVLWINDQFFYILKETISS